MTSSERVSATLLTTAHQFMVMGEDDYPNAPRASSADNGLARAWGGPGYVWIRTGISFGPVTVEVEARVDPPQELELDPWDDVVEVSEHFTVSEATARSYEDSGPDDWPSLLCAGAGWYRVRVHCVGRDLDYDIAVEWPRERFLIIAWPARRSPDHVLKQTDRTGWEWRFSAAEVASRPDQ